MSWAITPYSGLPTLLSWIPLFHVKLTPLIAFNFSTVHGAPGNNSPNRRRAFSARFTGNDATYAKRKGETSPPFPKINLKHGDKMNSETFPQIPLWTITIYFLIR